VCFAPGLRQLQCLSLRGCAKLTASTLGSLAPLQHLRSLDLAGLPLLQARPCCSWDAPASIAVHFVLLPCTLSSHTVRNHVQALLYHASVGATNTGRQTCVEFRVWDLQDASLGVALAALPQLSALNLGHTAAGDATLAALTYAHRAAAWSREHGVLRIRV
jgi:hypothetical protein